MRGAARGEERLKLPESSAKRGGAARADAARAGARASPRPARAGVARYKALGVARGRGAARPPRACGRGQIVGAAGRARPPRRPTARRAAGAHMVMHVMPRGRARARGGAGARGHPTAVVA